ncbi:MAG: PsiF family protein [Asticcacaulis sp.]
MCTIILLEWSSLVSLGGVAIGRGPILTQRRPMTTERSIVALKYRAPERRPVRLYSSAVQPCGATLRSSSTRGAPMMTISSRAAVAAFASLFLISSAFAQTTAPAAPAPAAKMAPAEKKAEKPRTAASLECSKEADTKGVHGKERKKFMSECKKAAKDAAAKPKS